MSLSGPIAILVDAAALNARAGAEDLAVTSVGDVAEAVRAALLRAGRDARVVPLPAEPTALFATASTLAREAGAIFNLAESLERASEGEIAASWLAAMTGRPVTGAPPRALSLCLDKPLARAVLAAHGVPVPDGRVVRDGTERLEGLPFPAIVKPAAEDASHGIDEGSVVHDLPSAMARARDVAARFGAALVEELIVGREIQVAMLGRRGQPPELLPMSEIDYSDLPAGAPPILTYAAKWDEASESYRRTPAIAARPLDPALERAVCDAAVQTWLCFDLAGYARVDLRVHSTRGPFVIDVNPNPDLSVGAGLALAAGRAGISHDQLVLRILDLAAPHFGPGP